ncbi:MAG: hypothetical protein KatS3mg119_2122 [Rhodothalassiaceae bacterium]|nr:MAG: hypothetical protein KatS3mg119_2122 [Rhodothalassiaceae bacterium]
MYERLVHFAGTWGLGLLMLLFAVAVMYALWPGNRDKFRRMAELPLHDDPDGAPAPSRHEEEQG